MKKEEDTTNGVAVLPPKEQQKFLPQRVTNGDEEASVQPLLESSPPKEEPKDSDGIVGSVPHMKHVAFMMLVTQMVSMTFLVRISRTANNNESVASGMYISSTAVFCTELVKLVTCSVVIFFQTDGRLLATVYHHIIETPWEVAKLSVPSLLYTVQNNLLYVILSNLDAATYQVCNQLKILTTALCMCIMLGRKFSAIQWAAIAVLAIGVALVEVSGVSDSASSTSESAAATDGKEEQDRQNRITGFTAVLFSALTSGFAGVFFEKILKGSQTSLWVRNVQMYISSSLLAFVTIFVKDGAAVQAQGFWGGYNGIVWVVIALQSLGGLLVSVVVKYADNLVKVFATSFSIIISCLLAALFFDFQPNLHFVAGTGCVIVASIMYSRFPLSQK